MKALLCSDYGGTEKLKIGELPVPNLQNNQLLIRNEAAGISFVDTLMIRDLHQNKHPLPFAPGMEVAGIVAAAPQDSNFKQGDRVTALVYDGGLAEYAVANVHETFALPPSLSASTAAACLSTYLTSGIALIDRAGLRQDESVLILGAAGGTGLAAVDIATALGARVIAAASTAEKLTIAKQAGAELLIDYTRQDLKATLKEEFPEGVNVVFDPVAGPSFTAASGSLGWGGRYLIIGFAGGNIPQFAANRLLVKQRSALGFVLMYYRRFATTKLQTLGNQLLSWMDQGRLSPLVSRVGTLDEAPGMLQAIIDRKAVGKMVVTL